MKTAPKAIGGPPAPYASEPVHGLRARPSAPDEPLAPPRVRLARVAIVCLIIENFLLLLATLAFLLGLPNSRLMTTASVLVVFSDAGFLLSLAGLFAVIASRSLPPSSS